MEKNINNNGYDYVDLGLPSGTLWATSNVGADKPSDSGLYFQWADIRGYRQDQVGIGKGKKEFSSNWKLYKWYDCDMFTQYVSNNAKLELEDDMANANMGGSWHIPSPTQIRELINETSSEWTTLNGVNGCLFTSKKDKSKFIFIPAAGSAWNGTIYDNGKDGGIWSSMVDGIFTHNAKYLLLRPKGNNLGYDYRCSGHSVRGVIG